MLMLPPPSVAVKDHGYPTPPPSTSPSVTTLGSASSTSTLKRPKVETHTDYGISTLSAFSSTNLATRLPQSVTAGPPTQRRSWRMSYDNLYIVALLLAACFIIIMLVLPIFRDRQQKLDNGATTSTYSTYPY